MSFNDTVKGIKNLFAIIVTIGIILFVVSAGCSALFKSDKKVEDNNKTEQYQK